MNILSFKKNYYILLGGLLSLTALVDYTLLVKSESKLSSIIAQQTHLVYEKLNKKAFFSEINPLSEMIFYNVDYHSEINYGLHEANFLSEITRWIDASKMGLVSITSSHGKKENHIFYIDYKLSIKGMYIDLLSFLNEVESSHELLEVLTFRVKKDEYYSKKNTIIFEANIRNHIFQKVVE